MARRGGEQSVSIDGHTLRVSNLDKVLYPQTGTTKGEVIDYYARVAPTLISYAAWRPATRKRWVEGVGTEDKPLQPFFRKDLEDSAPSWIPTGKIQHSDHVNTYPLVNEPAVLAWLGQVAALEIHVPQWRFDPTLNPQNPDRMVLDLDPGPGAGLAECVQVAKWCREILEGMGMQALPVTSGSKGIHLYAPLDGTHTSEQISAVAREMARSLEQDQPELVVSNMKRSLREGKVLVDWSQNNATKTTICPYSLRGRAHPTVAVPRHWEELEDPDLRHLEYPEVLQRLEEGNDPLTPLADTASTDRLATYRSMRDAAKTPEPVPEPRTKTTLRTVGQQATFVIQKHQARRLHWDFRLEHDGVLVSWAVPKGPPLRQGVHRLAVMTEDHPLEYASFHGSIPKGEYGAGTVEIWDTGTCRIEEWEDDKKVIAVLEGRPDGGLEGVPRRFVLIHAKNMDGERNWLLQLTKDQPSEHERSEPEPSEESDAPASRPKARATRKTNGNGPRPAQLPELRPMLATAGSLGDIDPDECWSFEMKWDGYRALVGTTGGKLSITSRNGKDLTELFPELAEITGLAPQGSILDGEIVALDSTGRPDFGLLQQRLSSTAKSSRSTAKARSGAGKPDVHLMLFDALALPVEGGAMQDLTDQVYQVRRERLQQAVREGRFIHIPPAHHGAAPDAVATSEELGLEGIVAKECDSSYEPGRRSREWIKIKHQAHQEVVVIGWRQGQGARSSSFGSLLLAIPDQQGTLHYAGRVGAGFREEQLTQIRARLQKLTRKTPSAKDVPAADQRDAHWVSPKLVGEVQYSETTRDGRLRHPVWRGWRPDKDPEQVRRE